MAAEILISTSQKTKSDVCSNGIEKFISVGYCGAATIDRRYIPPVLHWVALEIVRKHENFKNGNIYVTDTDIELRNPLHEAVKIHQFSLDSVYRLSRLKNCGLDNYMGFITSDTTKSLTACKLHVLKFDSDDMKTDFLKVLKYKVLALQKNPNLLPEDVRRPSLNLTPPKPSHRRGVSSGAILLSPGSADAVFRDSVYYIGKVTISKPQAPPKFIDGVLVQLQKMQSIGETKKRERRISASDGKENFTRRWRQKSEPSKNGELDVVIRNRSSSCNSDTREKHNNKDSFDTTESNPGKLDTTVLDDNGDVTLSNIQQEVQTRLVTLSISKTSLMLFSVGSKNLLLEKKIKNISFCTKGEARSDHFGFICRENGIHVCYIFQGESELKVDAIMKSMKLAFTEALEASAHLTLCEDCPLQYFHKLCTRLENASTTSEKDNILQETIGNYFLSDYETLHVMNSVNEAGSKNDNERISITVEVLRSYFDEKQKGHKHTKAQSQLIVDQNERPRSSTIFEKAKKSLSSSFVALTTKKVSSKNVTFSRKRDTLQDVDAKNQPPPNGKPTSNPAMERIKSFDALTTKPRSRSYESSASCPTTPEFAKRKLEFKLDDNTKDKRTASIDEETAAEKKDTVGDVKEFENKKEKLGRRGSWRQEKGTSQDVNVKNQICDDPWEKDAFQDVDVKFQDIYWSVTSSTRKGSIASITTIQSEFEDIKETVDPHQRARERWKSAIMNQILLIRMEKENKKLAAKISATEVRRQKLSYQDLSSYSAEAASMWDELLARRVNERVDDKTLLEAVRGGVPRMRRGEIWQFLIKQHTIRSPDRTDEYHWKKASYKGLVTTNTTHQHAILIDLGRTFPTHAHFIPRLGSGQLCLFNVLKAYAAVDDEVGYCQGLSFVAGLLLMHLNEEDTFKSFCHLMYGLQIRNQYKPDMNAVQQQLYQLSRLLHDYHPSVYEHFNTHDVTPTLYAAPWFLTLFASTYPIGFVSRVMDLILLQGMEVVFKVALVLVGNHTEEILACENFETIVEYMKTSLPNKVLNDNETDDICSRAINMDIKHQLNLYEVEYQLLKEEMIDIRQNKERLEKELVAHQVLENEVITLKKELQNAKCAIDSLKLALNITSEEKYELEKQLKLVTVERDELKDNLTTFQQQAGGVQQQGESTTSSLNSEQSSDGEFQNEKPVILVNGDCVIDSS